MSKVVVYQPENEHVMVVGLPAIGKRFEIGIEQTLTDEQAEIALKAPGFKLVDANDKTPEKPAPASSPAEAPKPVVAVAPQTGATPSSSSS